MSNIIPKYNYKKFTDLEIQLFDKLKEIRQIVTENFPEANHISMCMINNSDGYITVRASSSVEIDGVENEDVFIDCAVWDKEGIEDEKTNTDE